MATKKKPAKKKARKRASRTTRWATDSLAPGTITVTLSLVHFQRLASQLVKSLRKPKNMLAFRNTLDEILTQTMQQKSRKPKGPKGKPDPHLN